MHRGYLAATLVCFGLTALSYVMAARNFHMVGPDPPPPGYWAKMKQDEPWFFAGCCSVPVFGFFGLLFLYGTFAAARSGDGGKAAG